MDIEEELRTFIDDLVRNPKFNSSSETVARGMLIMASAKLLREVTQVPLGKCVHLALVEEFEVYEEMAEHESGNRDVFSIFSASFLNRINRLTASK